VASAEDDKPKNARRAPKPRAPSALEAADPEGRIDPLGRIDAQRLIEWTGERCVPWADDIEVVYEHYHRYLFAAAIARGRRVLDLATGEGYGAALLATQANEVVAVDLDEASIDHARSNYRLENLTFQRADMLDLSELADGSFDLVTCFEALEHVAAHDRVVAEVLRVLAPDGVLLLSTPDRAVYSDSEGRDNPFHVHELSHDELAALLSAHFPEVRLWGQNVAVGSVIVPLGPERGPGEVLTLTREHDGWTPGVKLRPTYLLAVASRAPLPELPDYSTLVDLDLELVRRSERERDLARTEAARVVENQEEISRRLVAEHEEALHSLQRARRRAEYLEQRQAAVLAELRTTRQHLDSSMAELDELKASVIFRLVRPFARMLELVAPAVTPRRQSLRRFATRAAQSMPRREGRSLGTLVVGDVPQFALGDEPEVSIIVPVHDNWALTAACLRSLSLDASAVRYEIIAVDDASTDETRELLPAVAGIRAVRLDENLGFVGAVNAGLGAASGRFIVLLNNDTLVRPGWLEALVKTVEVEDNVGVVGAKLVYPDGRLQEAGGIIWRDATGYNYGKGGDADDPAFNFLRDVDYCSGACLLVRREILDTVGGLDSRYAPAYYEDTDLAFAARKLGYRVVYQPESEICHVEGASHGTDEGSGIKRHQELNRVTFRLKWQTELEGQAESSAELVRLASRHAPAGRVLVVDDRVPMPDRDSGSRRMSQLILLLRDLGLAVTFVPNDGDGQGRYAKALQREGIEVLHGTLDRRKLLRDLAPGLDVAILSRPDSAWRWLPLVEEHCPATKIIYDTVDLHFLREARRAEVESDPTAVRAAKRYYNMELSLATRADAVLVVSENERQALLREQPDLRIYVVGNVHPQEPAARPFAQREGVLFVGSFPHPPNRDAAHFLVEEIMPLVRAHDPGIVTYIVGSHPTDDILELASDSVRVLGWVPDLRDLYERVRLSVAPLRYGAGVKGKIGESLAYGLPVVTSPLGAEGMDLEHGRDALVADGAEAFAAEILRVYHDAELWNRLSANGRGAVAKASSPPAMRALLAAILADVGVDLGRREALRPLTAIAGRPDMSRR
jgi:GT2 family glycosyltransferase/SAM-dependent methyltransferase/glycosyltransferase involved in cell wall biosynthesis